MKFKTFYVAFSVLSSLLITGCSTLPTSGPNQSKILDVNRKNLRADIIDLDNQSVQSLHQSEQNQLFSSFSQFPTASGYAGTANVGDVLEISIWEAPPAVLFGGTFSSEGQGNGHLTQLPPQTVNAKGTISVPFVGNLSVRNKTPEAIGAQITSALQRKANQPQVLVRIVNNQSADVTVIRQGNSIRMPLTPSRERVLDAIAAVGGSNADIQDITVQLTRNSEVKTLPFETLIENPVQNVVLQSGDVVSLLTTPHSFTGLGAVGNNQQMKFSTKGLTLAEAIGRMGGLLDSRSDPRGVFVFRYVPYGELDAYKQVLWSKRGYHFGMDVPTVYRVNLLKPESMFVMQRFPIKDKDIVYVSNAPLAEFQKFLRMVFSITSPITSTATSVNNF